MVNTMTMKTHDKLLECSIEDKQLFDRITQGLPDRAGFSRDYMASDGKEIPYGSGAHIIQHIRRACDIVKPKEVFEIGFNRGHGSAIFLEVSDANIFSIDISTRKETLHAAFVLKNRYADRFNFLGMHSGYVYPTFAEKKFDLAFVDGAHDKSSVVLDIKTCKRMKIPYLLFDDYYSRYGEVAKAIGEFEDELELVEDMDNLRLYKTKWQ
jgi:hypothetical protein